jgi:hypothetical protein
MREDGAPAQVASVGRGRLAHSSDASAIVSSDQAKSVRMRFLRDVDKARMIDAFKEGFEKNSRSQAAALQLKLDQLDEKMTDLVLLHQRAQHQPPDPLI